jgi:superoxide dismutase, Fe-Mn family
MNQEIAPIPVRPWTLNGLSERLIVSHYENNYGPAVRTLNAVRSELTTVDASTPGYRIRALKREELITMGSVVLHELYFGNLGGEGNKIPDEVRGMLEEHFGSVAAWRRDFVGAAQSLAGGSGWVLLTYSRRQKGLWNQIAFDHSQAAVDAAPILVLDMYEHAYHLDFGANATAYIDAFMRNVNWTAITERLAAVRADRADRSLPREDPSDKSLPSLSIEELSAQLARGDRVQVLDARPGAPPRV